MSDKPHRGRITNWFRFPNVTDGLGYTIIGHFEDHPGLKGRREKTSYVVAFDEKTGEIETAHSRYTLVGPEFQEKS